MRLAAFPLALALAAADGSSAEPYRAQGSNPDWSLTMESGRIAYTIGARGRAGVEAPAPVEDEGIIYYRAKGFELTIMPMACEDKANGRRYAHSVFLTIAGTEHGGCGGALLPADSLDGTSWHFIEIGGESTGLTGHVLMDDRYAVDFGSDRFVAYSGCNRIGGAYRIAGGVMKIENFDSTRRACGEPYGRRELAARRIMSEPMRVSRPSADILQLAGESGTIRLRRSPD